jgi:hypothetical protein
MVKIPQRPSIIVLPHSIHEMQGEGNIIILRLEVLMEAAMKTAISRCLLIFQRN